MHKAVILDVGHGSAILFRADTATALIDVAKISVVLDYLVSEGITKIDVVIISHSDLDHVRGLVGLLASNAVTVGTVFVNPDKKDSDIWADTRFALADYVKKHPGTLRASVSNGDPGVIEIDGVKLSILSPETAVALKGVGSDIDGHIVDANDNSVVLQVEALGRPLLLVFSDMTEWAWSRLRANVTDLEADVIVLPHHGGPFGNREHYRELLARTHPAFAVASNGHNKHNNPRDIVVEDVRARGATMVCTQLSTQCGQPGGVRTPPHPACAGTIEFEFDASGVKFLSQEQHGKLVDLISDTALCRR